MKDQKSYNDFIVGILPYVVTVSLDVVKEYEGESLRYSTILGLCANKKVTVKLANVYSRSIEVKLVWDDKKETILVFCPLNKSPHEFLNELEYKIRQVVNNSYTNEELNEFEKTARSEFKHKIKNLKITDIKEI